MTSRLRRRDTGSLATAGVEQQAVAKANASVIQAGRDVITGNVFVGRFARLRDVWLDPASVFEEAEVDRFVGREWLVESVDKFIDRHDRGYVVVLAAAGLGKTAFAAWLARSRDLPCHFTRRRKGRVAATALRNLAAQLIARYELAERFAPNGMLPETAGEPGWFDQVLRAASEAAGHAGQRVVLVVDGLDEAEHVDGDLPLGLPAALPEGVFVVVTCRTGTPLAALRQPWQALTIEADDRRNAADLRRYLTARATDERLAALLADGGVSATAFARQLIDRCGGVWIYLRYVLDELGLELRGVTELDRLPADLAGYYLESLTSPNGDPVVAGHRARLLATLAAVPEPMPIDTLTRLAGLPSAEPVRTLCHGGLRPFLTTQADENGERRYGIYHVSLRDFLAGATPAYVMDDTRYRAEEFAQATRDAHGRIADHYLDRFGGLTTQLDALAADHALAGTDGGYPRRYLAYHLERAGRVDDLHRLLACETYGDHSRNVWFGVHDDAGSVGDYLGDIRRARRQAELATNAQLDAAEPTTGLGLEIRYAVMTAAVTTLTANIPIPLLHRLVTTGVWDVEQALRHAGRLHDPAQRAETLTALLPEVPPADREPVLADALAAARVVAIDHTRARLLVKLADHVPARLRRRLAADALAATRRVTDSARRADLLWELAGMLPGRLAATVLDDIRDLATEGERVMVLSALVRGLSTAEIEGVYATGVGIESPWPRAVERSVLAARLTSPRREQALTEAWNLATIDEPANRADRVWAMLRVTQNLPDEQREQALAEVVAAARDLSDNIDRYWALGRVVPDLPEPQRVEVVAEALANASLVADVETRAWLVGSLADDLTAEQREPVLDALLRAAKELPTDAAKTDVVGNIAQHLSDRLMADAVALISGLADEYARNWAIGRLAPGLPAGLLGDALAATRTMSDEYGAAQVLCQVALCLPEPRRGPLLADAVAVARTTTALHLRARVLAELTPRLTGPLLDQALTDAVAAARASEGVGHVFTMLRVARRLSEPQRSAVLTEALATARETADHAQRAWYLIAAARVAVAPLREELGAEALAAARSVPTSLEKVGLLGAVTSYCPTEQRRALLAEVIELARAIGRGETDPLGKVLARYARHVLRRIPEDALIDAIGTIASASTAPSLDELPHQLDSCREVIAVGLRYLPRRLVTELIAATRHLPDDSYEVAAPLGVAALLLPEPLRRQALDEALTPARYTTFARQAILTAGNALWESPAREHLDILRRCLDDVGLDDCLSVLAAAVPIVARAGGEAAVESCLDTVRTVRRWWHAER